MLVLTVGGYVPRSWVSLMSMFKKEALIILFFFAAMFIGWLLLAVVGSRFFSPTLTQATASPLVSRSSAPTPNATGGWT